MSARRFVRRFLVVCGAIALAHATHADNIFLIDGERPDRAIIANEIEVDVDTVVDSAMSRALHGVSAVLDDDEVIQLLRCTRNATHDASDVAEHAEPGYFVHLIADDQPKLVTIVRSASDQYGAYDAKTAVSLDAHRFERLLQPLPVFAGDYLEEIDPAILTQSQPIDAPYTASDIAMDKQTMTRRLFRGMRVANPGTDRVLGEDQMHVRLPASYSPRQPSGLLVWASPTPRGDIPHTFNRAADEMNLVCIGVDNTGNDRDVQDRYQLMLDAVATASTRYHIDQRRIYIAGMSGGGKIASKMVCCFPDVFTGGVSIVGLATWHTLGEEWGNHRRQYFTKPPNRMLKQMRTRPLAIVTGPADFNYEEMKERHRLLQRDGHELAKFFDIAEMGHTMPSPDEFLEAMQFVDEPYQTMREAEENKAAALLAEWKASRENDDLLSANDRDALAAVMEAGAWTEAAWQAHELLKQ